MMRNLLWRGMLAGLVGAFFAATFALLFAEPQIDAAVALEASNAAHAAHQAMPADEQLVSRATQKTWGLYTAMGLYGTALGGLLAIVFAGMYGRIARIGPRSLALLLALAAFIAIVLVPAIKYPPTPPAVGLLALSVLAATGATWTYRRLSGRFAGLDRLLIAAGVYLGAVALLQNALPMVDEVPADFPATLLWQFRLASIGTQAVFWLVAADFFGRAAERQLAAGARP
jgi:predicted cobalt transporter CbtA